MPNKWVTYNIFGGSLNAKQDSRRYSLDDIIALEKMYVEEAKDYISNDKDACHKADLRDDLERAFKKSIKDGTLEQDYPSDVIDQLIGFYSTYESDENTSQEYLSGLLKFRFAQLANDPSKKFTYYKPTYDRMTEDERKLALKQKIPYGDLNNLKLQEVRSFFITLFINLWRNMKMKSKTLETVYHNLPKYFKKIYGESPESPFIQFCPPLILYSLGKVPEEYLNLSEEDFFEAIKKVKGDTWYPSPTAINLKNAFWLQYDRLVGSFDDNSRVVDTCPDYYLYRNVCTEHIYVNILHKWENVAYIISSPEQYQNKLERSFSLAYRRINEILATPMKNADGELNVEIGNLILKTYALLDLRLKGSYTQRIETKSKIQIEDNNRNIIDIQGRDVNKIDIDEKIKELENKLGVSPIISNSNFGESARIVDGRLTTRKKKIINNYENNIDINNEDDINE